MLSNRETAILAEGIAKALALLHCSETSLTTAQVARGLRISFEAAESLLHLMQQMGLCHRESFDGRNKSALN